MITSSGNFGKRPAPRHFWIVALLFLAWNVMGDIAYYSQVTADPAEYARTDPYTAKLWAQMPTWQWAAYAVAVWGATLATLLLLARKTLAVPLYALSLAAVIAQFGYTFLATDIIAAKGFIVACAFPIFIALMGVVQLLYARAMRVRGIIG